MITAGILASTLTLAGGLGLLPTEAPDRRQGDPGPAVNAPEPRNAPRTPASAPIAPIGLGALAGATLVLQHRARRSDSQPAGALGLRPPPDMRVVFVPGYGDPHAAKVFDDLVAMTGIDPANVRWFDYRWITGVENHRLASKLVTVDAAALSLNSFLAGVAAEGHPVYVVGFSKGGATMAHLVAEWDRGFPGPSDAVVGTALLDPPIASGVTGLLQSIGRFWSALPDDGGYDPLRCTYLRVMCTDTRVDLGVASGVEVVVIQNPKAAITNIGVPPPGLRVVNAPDLGPTVLSQISRNPMYLPWRIADAHRSVLTDRRVAECITAEMREPGSCSLSPVSAAGSPVGPKPPLWSLSR